MTVPSRPAVCCLVASFLAVFHSAAAAVQPTETSVIGSDAIADVLRAMPDGVVRFHQHVVTLSNPFFEGRGPGTRGNELAAEYIEFHFRQLGLQPVFDLETTAPDGAVVLTRRGSYRQPFDAGTEVVVAGSSFTFGGSSLDAGDDYTVLGCAGSGAVDAPVVCAGYAIDDNENGYDSFPDDADLSGRIVLVFRFEPMDDGGTSRFTEGRGWSPAAGLAGKLAAVAARNPAAIVIVNPPGASDPRAGSIVATEASIGWSPRLSAPAFMISTEAAERLVAPSGRSLLDLREQADGSGGIIELSGVTADVSAEIDHRPRSTCNVAGLLPGAGALADQIVVVGAHFDHVGYGYTGGSRTGEMGVIHPGADDNGSGTAGLLLAAEKLAGQYRDMGPDTARRSILFMGFSAEEMGLIGSRFYTNQPAFLHEQTYAMLNMDMIGRLRDNKLELSGTGTAEGFEELLAPHIEKAGFDMAISPGGRGPSDHASFYSWRVPALHFFTGLHDEYHTPADRGHLILSAGAVGVVDLVCDVATDLAMRPEPLVFTSTDRRAARGGDEDADRPAAPPRMRVRFGIAPGNYADSETGVAVGEVFPGTSADDAGIKAGDRLTKWDDKPIGDIAEWMVFLSEHKPGDVVQVTIVRDGAEVVVPVTLKAADRQVR